MANLNKVVYLTEAQKTTLFSTGTVTANGTTVTYNENDIYITPQVIDSTPTSGSSNLITSGAVAAAIPTIPSNISAFTNDAGYITSADVPEGASAYTGTISAVGTTASTGTNNGFARGDHVHNITKTTINSVLGTGSGTAKFYREDGTWATPAYTTNTDENVKSAAVTAATTNYIVGSTTATTSTGGLSKHASAVLYTTADTGTSGYTQLRLGNTTATTSAGGKEGQIRLYGTNATYYVDLKAGAIASSNKTITLPNATGTVALAANPTIEENSGTATVSLSANTTYKLTAGGGSLIFKTPANAGTVTSITINTTSPVSGGSSTATTTSGTYTISLADGYGDTKNPYGTKSANYVLAGPANGNAAAPTFRQLGLSELSGADDVKAIEALTGTSGLLKKTAANTWALDTNSYVTSSGVTSITPGNGLLNGTGTTAITGTGTLNLNYGTSTKAIGTAAAGTATTVSRSDHVHSISLATGDSNGQVKIAGTNVSVKGLGSNAYTSTAYLPLTGGTMTGWVNFSSGGIQSSNNSNSGQLIFGSDFIGNNNSRYGVSLSSEVSDGDSDEYINEVGVYNDGVFIRGTSTSLNDGPEIKLNKNGLVIDDGTSNGKGSDGQVLMSNGSKVYWGTISTGSGTTGDSYVSKSGDTMTGNLTVSKSDGGAVKALNTEKGYTVSLDSSSSVGNHGIWSTGYWDGSAFQSDGKWIVYRGQSGNIYLNGRADTALADGDGNTITSTYVKKAGDTMTGQLHINVNHDVGGTAAPNDWAPFIIGAKDGEHIEMDTNEILCKSNGTTPTVLWLQDGTGTVKTGGKDASGVGLYVNTGNLQINNGYLKSVANGNTVTIGSQNGSYCHFMNSTNIPFYFNKQVVVDGNLTFYQVSSSAPSGIVRDGIGYSWYQGRAGALVRMTTTASTSAYYPILSCKSSNGDWSVGTYQNELRFVYTTDTNYNSGNNTPVNTVYITATGGIYGAVWNDYAEMRNIPEAQKESPILKPGMCVHEVGDGTMVMSTSRLERGCKVISDTFGFNIGETENCKTPIAVSGRALVYINEGREIASSHIGWPVCSGPNGTVSIMTEEEEEKYPSRIIGTISEIPDYDEWGSGNVKVDGRIWIYVR